MTCVESLKGIEPGSWAAFGPLAFRSELNFPDDTWDGETPVFMEVEGCVLIQREFNSVVLAYRPKGEA